jgi:arylsulfatase A-like enzyme
VHPDTPTQCPGRPCVLWVCADDCAAGVCGAYGNRQGRTPNLDLLASQGLRLDRAFCLYDLESDPEEAVNLAARPEHAALVGELLNELAGHVRRTARNPELLPPTDDVFALLDRGLVPAEESSP